MTDRERRTALDLAEGLHLAHATAALHTLGILGALSEPVKAGELAKRHRVDAEMLEGVLAYLAAHTDIVTSSGAGYVLGRGYDDQARFMIDLYMRAFAPLSADLKTVLRRPREATAKVDRTAQSDAFTDDAGDRPLAAIIRQLGFNHILDVGCGNASLLRALAANDPDFVGTGIDAGHAMCRDGRRLARAAGLAKRVRILEGDARQPDRVLGSPDLERIETVVARDFLNELCRNRGRAAVAWLRRMRRLLPGRVLVVADYYGQLGQPGSAGDRHILLHDFVQLTSGQGIPPGNCDGWDRLYRTAGCRLAHILEEPGSARFIHLVKL